MKRTTRGLLGVLLGLTLGLWIVCGMAARAYAGELWVGEQLVPTNMNVKVFSAKERSASRRDRTEAPAP